VAESHHRAPGAERTQRIAAVVTSGLLIASAAISFVVACGDSPDRLAGDASMPRDSGHSTTSDSSAQEAGMDDAHDAASPGADVAPREDDAAMVGACDAGVPNPVKTAPVVSVTGFGAKGDGVTDDTAAIQAAIESMTKGGTLVFAPGTYLYGGPPDSGAGSVIHVDRADVALWGYGGAELRSLNPEAQEIELDAAGTAIYGFSVTAPQFTRYSALNNHRIVLFNNTRQRVVDNHIDGGAAAGIFVYGADHFVIARNIVEDTEADSIHMTQGTTPTHDGEVAQNSVRAPGPYWGDDEVAVIGYLSADASPDSMLRANYNILVECNDLEDAGWGNGVDIGGGEAITIRNNKIAGIFHAGGIKLGTEASYPTFSTMNVLVEGNSVSHIDTTGTVKGDAGRTYFGGFEVAARQPDTSVQRILARNNTIDDTIQYGVRFEGTLCDLGFQNTVMTHTGSTAFGNQGTPTVPAGCLIGCSGNSDDDAAATSNLCNATSMPTDVTGFADAGL
jgi:hypothetical protein